MMRDIKPVIASTTILAEIRQTHVVKAQEQVLQALRYRAVWRSRHLIIFPIDCHPFRQSVSAVMEGESKRLLSCLERSTVKRLLLSPELSFGELCFWAELASQAGLPVFMRRTGAWQAKPTRLARLWIRVLDMIGALFLLVLLSPVLLMSSLLLLVFGRELFERRWTVGQWGNLYQSLSFSVDRERLPIWLTWLSRTRVVELPQLLNILWGDSSLVRSPVKESDLELIQSSRGYTI